jgi:hypothetical protein
MTFDANVREKMNVRPSRYSSLSGRFVTFLLLCAVIFPAAFSFAILLRRSCSLPVPYQDDYNAILNFAIRYQELPTPAGKLLLIATAQDNEYKLGFEHLVVAAELSLTHRLNFAFLTMAGDLFLLPIGYLLWLTYRDNQKSLNECLLAFVPVSLLFFSLTYWEVLNWAVTSLQQLPVIFFSLLSIYLLFEKRLPYISRVRFGLACLVAMLACWTSANGFILLPVGLLILVLRRSYLRIGVWIASFGPPIAAYLYRYQLMEPHASHRHAWHAFVSRPLEFLAFLGGVILQPWIAALLGLVMLISFTFAARSRFDRTNPVSFYSTVWIFGSGLMVAWVRGADFFFTASRYTMYSLLLLIFCYAFFSRRFQERRSNPKPFYVVSVALSFIIFVSGNLLADKNLEARRQMVFRGLELYRSNPVTNAPVIDPGIERLFPKEREIEKTALTEAIRAGIYSLPPEISAH